MDLIEKYREQDKILYGCSVDETYHEYSVYADGHPEYSDSDRYVHFDCPDSDYPDSSEG